MIAEGTEGVMEEDAVTEEEDAAMEVDVVMEVAKGELVVVDVAERLIPTTLVPSHRFKWAAINHIKSVS